MKSQPVLFAPNLRDLPVILNQSITPVEAVFELELSEDLRWFEGHFPGQPLLPGVAQLYIAATCAWLAWRRSFTGREMSRVKFRNPLLPKQRVMLCLTLPPAGGLAFQFLHGNEIAASGLFKA